MNYLNLMLQDTLIVTKHVQKAAIIDIPTATVKATSIGIKFEEHEIQYLLSVFNNPMEIRENGIFYEGKIYQCTRAERQSIYAKFGKRGLVLVQTKTLLIVASFSENMFGSVCVEAVEKLAEYFRKKDIWTSISSHQVHPIQNEVQFSLNNSSLSKWCNFSPAFE